MQVRCDNLCLNGDVSRFINRMGFYLGEIMFEILLGSEKLIMIDW